MVVIKGNKQSATEVQGTKNENYLKFLFLKGINNGLFIFLVHKKLASRQFRPQYLKCVPLVLIPVKMKVNSISPQNTTTTTTKELQNVKNGKNQKQRWPYSFLIFFLDFRQFFVNYCFLMTRTIKKKINVKI